MEAGTVRYVYMLVLVIASSLGFLVVCMQATSTIFFHGGSTVGCGCGANGFSGDALWKITSLYGGVEEDGDGGDVGGGFLSSTAWRFFFLGCPLVLAASAPSLVVRP